MGVFSRLQSALTGDPFVSSQRPRVVEGTVEAAAPETLEQMETEALRMVAKANTGGSLPHLLNRVVIFVFKTFAPFAVLFLTVPESIWVFTHLYADPDQTLVTLTGLFAILVDLGYLYLTVLLAMNKEALFQRRRAGIEIEAHEKRALLLQTILWWIVAPMDTLAQVVFLYSATKDSTFFVSGVVMLLVGVRVLSLFLTMFVVSFAGTELMTTVDRVANHQIEQANAAGRVLSALGTARLVRQRARAALQEELEAQELRREGQKLLSEVYSDARATVRRQLAAPVSPSTTRTSGAAKLGL